MTPMFRMLYAKAEYGDITRTRPEARRVKTCTGAVAVSLRLAKTSTSPTLSSPATPCHVTGGPLINLFVGRPAGLAPSAQGAHLELEQPYRNLTIRAAQIGGSKAFPIRPRQTVGKDPVSSVQPWPTNRNSCLSARLNSSVRHRISSTMRASEGPSCGSWVH